MDNFICKIPSMEEINIKWDYEIAAHPGDNSWIIWKSNFIKNIESGTRVSYYGILKGVTITEATVVISEKDENIQNKNMPVGDKIAYLTAFRTVEPYQGKGYFSKLYKYMENDLKSRGFTKVTLGIEPCEVKNMKIYFNRIFDAFIKTAYEKYPPHSEGTEPEKIMVNYYSKNLK